MPVAPTSPPRRVGLYVSLFVNVVLLAFIGFAAWHFFSHRPPDGWGRPEGLKPFMPQQIERLVPDSAKDKIKQIRETHATKFKELFDTLHGARDSLRGVLEGDAFDAAALKTALTQLRAAEEAVRAESADVVVEEFTAMTPDERKGTQDKLKEMRTRGEHHRGKDGDDDHPPPDDHGPDDDNGPPPPPAGAPPPPPSGGQPPPPPQGP